MVEQRHMTVGQTGIDKLEVGHRGAIGREGR
jgi:hypothetical protein